MIKDLDLKAKNALLLEKNRQFYFEFDIGKDFVK